MTARRLHRAARRGFTLLEVMVALAILAFLMAAISSTQGSSLLHGARVYNLTTATQLMHGVVLDLEEEYRLEGFSTNSVEGRRCDLPRGFEGFDCEYDLLAVDVAADNLAALGEQANSLVGSSPLMTFCGGLGGGAAGGDPRSGDATPDIGQTLESLDMQAASLAALAALADPTGPFAQVCDINLQRMCMNIPMIAGFIPSIIEQAAKSTRKLVVRLTWSERGQALKTLEIETFITAVPEAEELEGGGAP